MGRGPQCELWLDEWELRVIENVADGAVVGVDPRDRECYCPAGADNKRRPDWPSVDGHGLETAAFL
jgi:hypothetical protein